MSGILQVPLQVPRQRAAGTHIPCCRYPHTVLQVPTYRAAGTRTRYHDLQCLAITRNPSNWSSFRACYLIIFLETPAISVKNFVPIVSTFPYNPIKLYISNVTLINYNARVIWDDIMQYNTNILCYIYIPPGTLCGNNGDLPDNLSQVSSIGLELFAAFYRKYYGRLQHQSSSFLY